MISRYAYIHTCNIYYRVNFFFLNIEHHIVCLVDSPIIQLKKKNTWQ